MDPPARLRSIRSPLDPGMLNPSSLPSRFLPRNPFQVTPSTPGAASSLSSWNACVEQIGADVVVERREPLLPPLPRGLPYAFQRLATEIPRPARAVLIRIPLAPTLRSTSLRTAGSHPASFGDFTCYYRRVLTSHARASSASAPRLPDAGQVGFAGRWSEPR